MKKSLIALLVVLALIVTVSVFTVSAEDPVYASDLTPNGDGTATGYCPHCDTENMTWTAWANQTASGHYYLAESNAAATVTTFPKSAVDVVLHLNGNEYTCSGKAFEIQYKNTISFVDSTAGTGKMINTGTVSFMNISGSNAKVNWYSGTLKYARPADVSTKISSGGCINLTANNAVVNMYSGTMETSGVSTNGGIINIVSGVFNMHGGTLQSSITTSNANNGGAVYVSWYSSGSTLHTESAFNMYGGTITGINATNGGAVYVASGTFKLDGGTIENCKALTGHGGAVYTKGDVETKPVTVQVVSGTISGCSAPKGAGGAMIFYGYSTFDMSDGTIENCSANGSGGAMRVNAATVTFKMSDGEISGGYTSVNTTHGGNVYCGQAATFNITGGTIKNGKTSGQGGNIYLGACNANSVFSGLTVSGGVAGTGGNLYITKSGVTMSGCTISGGAAKSGANVYASVGNTGTFTLDNSKVNSAVSSGKDGLNSTINTVTGGGVFVEAGEVKFLNGSSMTGNIAMHGGSVVLNSANAKFTMAAGTSITTGQAYRNASAAADRPTGGNIYIKNGTFTMNGGTISNGKVTNTHANRIGGVGGNICMLAGTFNMVNGTISGGSFSNNTTGPVYGGNVYIGGGTFTMTDGTISGSTVTTTTLTEIAQGGNIYNAGTFAMNGGEISDGIAQNSYKLASGESVAVLAMGGNVYNIGTFTMTDGSITGGKAQRSDKGNNYGNGGNLYIAGGSVELSGGSITDGTAVRFGGNIYAEPTVDATENLVVTMSGVAVSGGTGEGGSNITLRGTTNSNSTVIRTVLNMSDGTIGDAAVATNGAAVYLNGNCDFNLSGGTIDKVNSANGAVALNSGTTTFTLSGTGKFNECTATGNGGAIYANTAAKIYITGGEIYKCKAPNGGAIAVMPADTLGASTLNMSGGKIYDCEVTDTTVGLGGAIYASNANVTVSGGSIENCKAYRGGAVYATSAKAKVYIQKTSETQYAVIKDCYAYDRGGSFGVFDSATLNISGGEIKDGRVAYTKVGSVTPNQMGCNIYAQGTVTMSGGTISGGGAVDADPETPSTWQSVSGGNIHVAGVGVFTMTGGTISGGMAGNGGNLYFRGTTTTNSITGGTIENGKAKAAGGNFASVTNAHTISLGAVTISGGYAGTTGGNIHTATGTYTMNGTTIQNGTAGTTGGNIHAAKAVSLTNCTLEGGTAGTTGGSIHATSALTINGGSITGGHSTGQGGNIYLAGANSSITGCQILNGVAGTKKVDENDDTVIVAPTTDGRGGNIAVVAAATITNCVIRDGEAWNLYSPGGGNVYITANTTLNGCTVTGGETWGAGGNIVLHGTPTVYVKGDSYIQGGVSHDNYGGNIAFTNAATLYLQEDTVIDGAESRCVKGAQYGNNIGISHANAKVYIEGNTVVKNGDNTFESDVIDAKGNKYLRYSIAVIETAGTAPKVYVGGNAQIDKIYLRATKSDGSDVLDTVAANQVSIEAGFTGLVHIHTQSDTVNATIVPSATVYDAVAVNAQYADTGVVKVLNASRTGYVTYVDNGVLKVCGITGFMNVDPDGIADSGDEYVLESGFATLADVVAEGYEYAKLYVGGTYNLDATTDGFPIDLNNQTVTINTNGYTLAPIDYRTDGAVLAKSKLTVDVDANVARKTQNPVNGYQYLNVKVGDYWTSNRVIVEISKVTVKTTKDGIYYRTKIGTNANAAPYLTDYGTAVTVKPGAVIDENFLDNLEENGILYNAFLASGNENEDYDLVVNSDGNIIPSTTSNTNVMNSALITGILKEGEDNNTRCETPILANSFVMANVDGEDVLFMADESKTRTMKEIMIALDEKVADLREAGDETTIATAVNFYNKWIDTFGAWTDGEGNALLKNLQAEAAA